MANGNFFPNFSISFFISKAPFLLLMLLLHCQSIYFFSRDLCGFQEKAVLDTYTILRFIFSSCFFFLFSGELIVCWSIHHVHGMGGYKIEISNTNFFPAPICMYKYDFFFIFGGAHRYIESFFFFPMLMHHLRRCASCHCQLK